MKRNQQRRASMAAVTACAGLLLVACVDAPPAPLGTLTGTPGTASPSAGGTAASLAITPQTVDINAPYSYGGNQSQTSAGLSQQPAAGYPTSAQLSVSFVDASGKAASGSDLVWSSSNPALVTVDGTGLVSSVDPGTSGVVTVTTKLKNNPQVTATATVNLHNDGKLSFDLQ